MEPSALDTTIESLLSWIEANPGWAGIIIGAVAFFESLAIFGLIVPGAVILFGIGTLVGLGALDLWPVMIWCSAGAVAGDGLSFWLGHHFKQDLRSVWPFSRVGSLIERGESYFEQHGGKSVFIGRFVGPIRPIAPVIAGMMGMSVPRYIVVNVVASLLWSPFYILPGVLFGASLELASAIAGRLAVVVVILIATVFLAYFLVNISYRFLAPRAAQFLDRATNWARNHPRVGRLASSILEPHKPETASLAILAILLIALTWVVGGFLLSEILPVGNTADLVLLDLVIDFRQPWSDQLFSFLALLSSPRLLLLAPLVSVVFLYLARQRLAAYHWVASVVFAFAASYVLTLGADEGVILVDLPTILSASFYGFTSVLIARELTRRWRVWAYVVTVLIVLAAAVGNLYLGKAGLAATFSGLILGWLWAALLGIAYRRHASASFRLRRATGLLVLSLVVGMSYELTQHAKTVDHAEHFGRAMISASAESWWENGLPPLPVSRPSKNFSAVSVDFETSAPLANVLNLLEQNGWQTAAEFGWRGLFLMLDPKSKPEALPVLPRALNGRPPAIQLLLLDGAQAAWLVRIWHSGYQLEQGKPILQLALRRISVKQQVYFFRVWRDAEVQPSLQILTDLLQRSEFEIKVEDGKVRAFR